MPRGPEPGGRVRPVARVATARAMLAAASLGVALVLEASGRGLPGAAERGVAATLLLALVVSALARLALSRRAAWRSVGAAQLAADLLLVSSLVHYTGGGESVFTPLYIVVVLYAAAIFDRPGAYGAAAASALAFGGVLLAEHRGLVTAFGGGARVPLGIVAAHWAVHAAAMLVVALLASVLLRDLRRAGEDLARSRDDLGALRRLHERTVESLLSGLLTTDGEGRITSFNPEAEQITGWSQEEALSAHIDEVLPGARDRVLAPRVASVRTLPESGVASAAGQVASARTRARMQYVNRAGERLHLGIAGSVLREADGAPAGHVLIFQDVSDVVRMELELRRSERLAAVGQLSASMAHEIRNPLAAISGSIQMLQLGAIPDNDVESQRLMRIVLRETDRLNALLGDFLQYARPGPARHERVVPAELFDEMAKMLASGGGEEIEIERDAPPSLALLGDAAQLRQLLWNLCRNAVQAMEGKGRLRLFARALGRPPAQGGLDADRNVEREEGSDVVELEVRDDGPGIAPDVLERIFDPFFTTRSEGSGLGLAIVHRIVEGHGGSLRVETAPGEGTAILVRLPRHRETS